MGHTQPGFQGGSGQYRQGLLQKAHASNIFKLGSQLKSKLFETYSGIAAEKPQHTATLRKQNMQILQDVATHDPMARPPGRTKVFGSVPATSTLAMPCGHESEKVRFHQKQQLQYVTIQINSTYSTIPTPFKKTERNVHHETPAKSP